MPAPTPLATLSSIVLIGRFNPAIFHPTWFAAQGLISQEEQEQAKLEVVTSEIAVWTMDSVHLQVMTEKWQLTVEDELRAPRARELASGALRLLEHTPVHALGLNSLARYQLRDDDQWRQIGERFSPSQPWRTALPGESELVGTTREAPRSDGHDGFVRVRLERPKADDAQLVLAINDHFMLAEPPKLGGAAKALEILEQRWADSIVMANDIFDGIWESFK